MNAKLAVNVWGYGDRMLMPDLPIAVVGADGTVYSRQKVNLRSGIVQVPFDAKAKSTLFVRLDLPNGSSEVQPIGKEPITFHVGTESPRESMSWSMPRMRIVSTPLRSVPVVEGAWMQPWELSSGAWKPVRLSHAINTADNAFHLSLKTSAKPTALVVSMGGVPRVLTLPRGREARVLVGMTEISPGVHRPGVIVGGYGASAEGLMEFLRKGFLERAEVVADPGASLAHRHLLGKHEDPLAAVAAAYYLLRRHDWDRMPHQWLDNLARYYGNSIPDTFLIRAAAHIKRGMTTGNAEPLAAQAIAQAFGCGLPLFSEAASLVDELFSLGHAKLTEAQANLVRSIMMVAQPAGITFGYAGSSPAEPADAWTLRDVTREEAKAPPPGAEHVVFLKDHLE